MAILDYSQQPADNAPVPDSRSGLLSRSRVNLAWLNSPRQSPVLWCIALVCVAAYLPPLIGLCFNAWPFGDDALAATAPWRELTRSALREGLLPLWNPHLFCGIAFMSTGQSGVLYPPNLLYWLLPIKSALLLDATFHNMLLAIGTYALARALHLSRPAAWVSAVSLALSSAVSAHVYAGHMNWHAARAYLPWELWALLWYLRSGQARYAFILAIAFGLQIAAGYPPLILLSAALCCGLIIAWCATRWRERHHLSQEKRASVRLMPPGWLSLALCVTIITALLGAVQILPLRELSRLSVHGSGLSYAEATEFSGTWRTFFKIFAPGFFGGTADLQWSTPVNPHEEAGYIGLLTAILALGAPWLARRYSISVASSNTRRQVFLPRPVWWLWALLPITALLALGDNTPLYRWLFDHIIFFRMTRLPTRWLEVWCFAGALLAGFAFDGCLHSARNGAVAQNDTDKDIRQTDTLSDNLSNARFVMPILWFVTVGMAALGIALLMVASDSPLWLTPAQQLFRLVATGDALKIAEVADNFRTMAILECFMVCILAGLAASLWRRWQQATAVFSRNRIVLLLAIFMTLDVMVSFWRYPKIVPEEHDRKYLSWPLQLKQVYRPEQRWSTQVVWVTVNRGVPLGIDLFNGYDPMSTKRYFEFAHAVEGREFWNGVYQPGHYPPLLRVVGLTHTLSQSGIKMGPDAVRLKPLAKFGQWKLWQHPEPWPRVYLSRIAVHAPEAEQLDILKELAAQPYGRRYQPVIVSSGAYIDVVAAPLTSGEKIISWKRALNSVTTETSATAPAVLVQGEAWYPGWRAWVNGQPVPLERVNFMFRGTRVPSGPARVQHVYVPQTYRFSLFLTLCGLATVTGILMVWIRARTEA